MPTGTLTFPWPEIGTVARPPGQGCLSCQQQGACPALYWFVRNNLNRCRIDDYLGRACLSWTSDPAQQVKTASAYDIEENDRRADEGVLMEADRNGISDPITANAHEI